MPQIISRVRIPHITSIETAIRLYYERIELNNDDIRELFGKLGSATIAKLKNVVRDRMRECDTPSGTLSGSIPRTLTQLGGWISQALRGVTRSFAQ